jgi:FixJ family two-component response regulator
MAFFTKPVNKEMLVKTIREALSQSVPAASAA